MTQSKSGSIITFYSYKGGTGRSMALANVAWILASAGKKVLAIDWDLEAPGLHRYFRPFLPDHELLATDGLIDFVNDYCDEFIEIAPSSEAQPGPDWFFERANLLYYKVSLNWAFPEGATLDLVPAGRQGDSYGTTVNLFDWRTFYTTFRGGDLIAALRERMRQEYDYVLIDSRTGVSDTAGICTIVMPDILAVCFTLNNQSIQGARSALQTIMQKRAELPRREDDNREPNKPLLVCPLPMRVDIGDPTKAHQRREYARAVFSPFLSHISGEERQTYWGSAEVFSSYGYSYEEVLAVFRDTPGVVTTILAAYERITRFLTGNEVTRLKNPPGEAKRHEVLANFAAIPQASESSVTEPEQRAEALLNSFTASERAEARRILERLVRVLPPDVRGDDSRVSTPRSDLGPHDAGVLNALAAAGLITVEELRGDSGTVELPDDRLLKNWQTLRQWLDEDRGDLFLRQVVREYAKHKTFALPPNHVTAWASRKAKDNRDFFNSIELDYLRHVAFSRKWWLALKYAGGAALLLAVTWGIWWWRQPSSAENAEKTNAALGLLTAAAQANDPLDAAILARDLPDLAGDQAVTFIRQIVSRQIPTAVIDVSPAASPSGGLYGAVPLDGGLLFTAGGTGICQLWKVPEGRKIADYGDPTWPKWSAVAALPERRLIALAGLEGQLWLWSASERKIVATTTQAVPGSPSAMAVSRDGQRIAVADYDGHISLMDAAAQKVQSFKFPHSPAYALAFTSAGLLAGNPGGKLTLVDPASGKSRDLPSPIGKEFGDFTPPVTGISVSKDGEILVAVDRHIWLLDQKFGVRRPLPMPDEVFVVVFSPDGKRFAAATGTSVYVYSLTDLTSDPVRLEGHQDIVQALTFGADSRTLASASRDGTARLWDLDRRPDAAGMGWDEARRYVRSSANGCLSVAERQKAQNLTAAAAQEAYTQCVLANRGSVIQQ